MPKRLFYKRHYKFFTHMIIDLYINYLNIPENSEEFLHTDGIKEGGITALENYIINSCIKDAPDKFNPKKFRAELQRYYNKKAELV